MTLLLTTLTIAWALGVLTLITNLWYLRRGVPAHPGDEALPSLSVLIPARNEAANLRRLLPSLLAQRYPDFEVIIYDDSSEDGTVAVAEATRDRRVRVIRGDGPATGWVGKVHALYQASRQARGARYLFLDADTEMRHPDALRRLVARHEAMPAPSVLTGLPRFAGGGLLLVSAVPYGLLLGLPLPLVPRVRARAMGALNGQCWIITARLYHDLEPHREHRNEVLEDVRIGRWLRARGVVPRFQDVQHDLTVFMYGSVREAWDGFRKNTYLVLGGTPFRFGLWWLWLFLLFILGPARSPTLLAAMWASKLIADRFHRIPVWVSALAPVTFILWSVVQLDSAVRHWRGHVHWKGRQVGAPATGPK